MDHFKSIKPMRISLQVIISTLCFFLKSLLMTSKKKIQNHLRKNPALWISLSVGKMVKEAEKIS